MTIKIRVVYRQKLYKFLYEKVTELVRNAVLEHIQALDDDALFFIPPDFTVIVIKGSKPSKNVEVICELRFSIL